MVEDGSTEATCFSFLLGKGRYIWLNSTCYSKRWSSPLACRDVHRAGLAGSTKSWGTVWGTWDTAPPHLHIPSSEKSHNFCKKEEHQDSVLLLPSSVSPCLQPAHTPATRKDQPTLLWGHRQGPTQPFGRLIRCMVLIRQETEAPVALYRIAWNLFTIFNSHSFSSFPLPSFGLPQSHPSLLTSGLFL